MFSMLKLFTSINVPCETPELSQATSLAISDKHIAVGLQDSSVHVYSIVDGTHKLSFYDPCCHSVWALCVIDDEVIVGGGDGILRIWEVEASTLIYNIGFDLTESHGKLPRISLIHASASMSGHAYMLVAIKDGSIRMRRYGANHYSKSFLGQHDGLIMGIETYNNGGNFISAAYEGTVCAWSVSTDDPLWKMRTSSELYAIAIIRDKVVLGDRDGSLRVLSLEHGTELVVFSAHSDLVNGLILHQDRLISTSTDGFAKLWSPSPLRDLFKLSGSMKMHDHAVVARCSLGSWLITGGKEGGGAENSCGIDATVKTWQIGPTVSDIALELGTRAIMVSKVASCEVLGRVFCLVRRRGRPILEIWESVQDSFGVA